MLWQNPRFGFNMEPEIQNPSPHRHKTLSYVEISKDAI